MRFHALQVDRKEGDGHTELDGERQRNGDCCISGILVERQNNVSYRRKAKQSYAELTIEDHKQHKGEHSCTGETDAIRYTTSDAITFGNRKWVFRIVFYFIKLAFCKYTYSVVHP